MNILKRIKSSLRYRCLALVNILSRKLVKPPIVESMDNTLKKVINEKYSICRYGDGEFKAIFSSGNGFQKYDEKLANRLKEIIVSNDNNIIIGLPDIFDTLDQYVDNAGSFWNDYLIYNRIKIYKLLNKNKVYYNSFITRPYMDWKDKSNCKQWFERLILWHKRDIVIIEGEGSRLGVGNTLFNNAKSVSRILAPAKNAFDKYDDILLEASKINKDKLILVALGQTATVLAYDLNKLGYQVIDIGHFDVEYEWFLMKATKKTKVKNKFVNESNDGRKVYKINDEKYSSEIICTII